MRFHVPGLPHAGPAKPPSGIGKIALPPVVPVGSFLTLHGTLPAGETGTVSVEGAYRGPPWRLLATVPAADGSYAARIRVDRRGLLHFRVTYPDGYRAVGSVHIR